MMEYVRGLQGLKPGHRGAAITVGSFDGIHLGHGALIARACALANQAGRPAMMLTFEPLPREYLSPQDPPARLTDFRERWRVLERSDLAYLCVLRFDEKLRSLTGEQFVSLLTDRFAASAVIVGQDFRFGRGGAGSVALLRAAADAGRFALELVSSVCVDDVRVSSSGVRAALAAGVASLGFRPTIGGTEPLLEAHVFDFDGSLYGRELDVEFVAKIRDEEKFASLDALVQQMHRDADEARRILSEKRD
jgi:riboflavin kinase/FMN adenylyltransferase